MSRVIFFSSSSESFFSVFVVPYLDEVVFREEGDGHLGRLEPEFVGLVLRKEAHEEGPQHVGHQDAHDAAHLVLCARAALSALAGVQHHQVPARRVDPLADPKSTQNA